MHDRATPRADPTSLDSFEEHRATLSAIAYRMLGSVADAADVVQDCYLAWSGVDRTSIVNPRAWLVTVCSRRSIDLARAAHRSRVDYVGPWLPDLVRTGPADGPAEAVDLLDSVSTAFLVLLERLTPRERAAYVLREVFGLSYADLAATLGASEAACRQLVSRAGRRLDGSPRFPPPSREHQQRLLDAFVLAVRGGPVGDLVGLLADDVELAADANGLVPTIRDRLDGTRAVAGFCADKLTRFWADADLVATELNGTIGIEVWAGDQLYAAVAFSYRPDGAVSAIHIQRHPDKLAPLTATGPDDGARHNAAGSTDPLPNR